MTNKEELIFLLDQCTKRQQSKFVRLYSNNDRNLPYQKVVDKMDDANINWAMHQAQTTINLNKNKIELKLKKIKDTIDENKKRICK